MTVSVVNDRCNIFSILTCREFMHSLVGFFLLIIFHKITENNHSFVCLLVDISLNHWSICSVSKLYRNLKYKDISSMQKGKDYNSIGKSLQSCKVFEEKHRPHKSKFHAQYNVLLNVACSCMPMNRFLTRWKQRINNF